MKWDGERNNFNQGKRKSRIEIKPQGENSDWATLREAWAVYLYVRDYILLGEVDIYTREYIRYKTMSCSIECLVVVVLICKDKKKHQSGGSCWPASHRQSSRASSSSPFPRRRSCTYHRRGSLLHYTLLNSLNAMRRQRGGISETMGGHRIHHHRHHLGQTSIESTAGLGVLSQSETSCSISKSRLQ